MSTIFQTYSATGSPFGAAPAFGGAAQPIFGGAAAGSPFGGAAAAKPNNSKGRRRRGRRGKSKSPPPPKPAASPFGAAVPAFGATAPNPFGSAPAKTPSGFSPPAPSPFGAAPAKAFGEKPSPFSAPPAPRARVEDIYRRCNPAKLAEVPQLLAKFAGQEAGLVRRLEAKYATQLKSSNGFSPPVPPKAPPPPPPAQNFAFNGVTPPSAPAPTFTFGGVPAATPATTPFGLAPKPAPATPAAPPPAAAPAFEAPKPAPAAQTPGAGWAGPKASTDLPVKVFPTDASKALAGVVVTVHESGSYDELFRRVEPRVKKNARVEVYELASYGLVPKLLGLLRGTVPAGWEALERDLHAAPRDQVLLNLECCGCCGDHAFPGRDAVSLVARCVELGFSVLCSDFSLKSLLAEWTSGSDAERKLGPCPFVRLGEYTGEFQLAFDVAQLAAEERVPQQLRVLGELCDDGKARVDAAGGTIVFGVRHNVCPHLWPNANMRYELKTLTTADCGFKGAAGHVVLAYPSGGQLLASMGHWIALTNVNTSAESVFRVAEKRYGAAEAESFRTEYRSCANDKDRKRVVQSRAANYIQSSSACRG